MMKIYLMRHGDALVGGDDNERSLSERGKADLNRIAKFITPLKIEVSQMLHSKKRRARQTAEILASAIVVQNAIQSREGLDPLESVIPLADEIETWNDDTLLVGHMPFMGKLASFLVTGNENRNTVSFQTGSIVCLEKLDPHWWIINWVLSPELFWSAP